jgi:hypothetical protein
MMFWTSWACLGVVIVGFALFLCGANAYNATAGWAGVYLFIGGILIYLVLYIYRELNKKEPVQKP